MVPVQAAAIICLEISDYALVARLYIRCHVRRKIKNRRVLKGNPVRKLINGDMSGAIVENEQHLPVGHAVEVLQPFQEDVLRHPSFGVMAILVSKVCPVDVLKAPGIGVLANDPEGNLAATIAIAADSHRDPFFVLFAAWLVHYLLYMYALLRDSGNKAVTPLMADHLN
ncbi:hypothetical protein SeMB42_g07915 [Synchytrium endobioticum]|uniref:Uncharacterized protein n=1 Tax=Synchytrium endobioticum TaxID=286115 RepID=A0A507BXG3_9FUNG|nr:hypothetical protein SeMB42_g07978 [Synchytrium endobioticum]TPX30474.1 hypothetical protein SeMB42_g07915 [Synchytrium endobioticum]TPX51053.1 hypothetical protein SeLEV6574_g00555 [Synchytrium endobioticum]